MSSTRYIQIVSTHRDRVEYPLVGDFNVPISGSNLCNSYTQDPISNQAPIYVFQLGSIGNTGTTNNGTRIKPGIEPSTVATYSSSGNRLYTALGTTGAFRGYLFTDSSISTTASPTGANRLVVDSEVGVTRVVLDIAEDPSYASGQNYGLTDYSGRITNFANIPVFDPNPYPDALPVYDFTKIYCPQPFDVFGKPCPTFKSYFVGKWLRSEPITGVIGNRPAEDRLIVDYNPERRQIYIESPFANSPVVGNPYNFYSIRSSTPASQYPGKTINGSQVLINSMFQVVAGPPPVSPNTLIVSGATPLTSGQDPGYAGGYLYIVPDPGDPAINQNYIDSPNPNVIQEKYMYRIDSYPANDTFILERPIDYTLYTGGTLALRSVEFLPVNQNNYVPLTYSGTITSQNQPVCYEIGLTSLILPNVPLVSGSRAAFYPYVYVLLENEISTSGRVKNIFYSNNPSSGRALFIAPVTDTKNPVRTPYVRINGFGIIQTVKFKPNDTLHFKVFMPDGTLFQPQVSPSESPVPPDPFVQISAVFSIKRVA